MNPLMAFAQLRWGKPFASRAAIALHQARGLDQLRRKIMPRSPFHAPYAGAPISEWPLMDKAQLMAGFSQINTFGLSREDAMALALLAEESRDFKPRIGPLAVGLSTGTSGQRGLFLTNRRERALWAAVMCARFWPRPLLQRQRIAFFLRANNALYERLANPLLAFDFYDLLAPFEQHMTTLRLHPPTVLIAPAQVLRQLALAQAAGEMRLAPKVIISVAEVLSPEDAALIEQVFGRRPEQVYQCTEGVLGWTCKAGNLHLNERFIRFDRELLDAESGAFAPVLTDFSRESLPILRYRLDDVLIPDPRPCPCGCATTRIARIEGRCDDMLVWPGSDGRPRMMPSDVIRQAMACTRVAVKDYRAEQAGDRLTLWLDTDQFSAAAEEVTARLRQLAEGLKVQLPPLTFRAGLPVSEGAKLRRVSVKR